MWTWNANRIRWLAALVGSSQFLILQMLMLQGGVGRRYDLMLMLFILIPAVVLAVCTFIPPSTPERHRRMGLATLWILVPLTIVIPFDAVYISPGRLNRFSGALTMLVWLISTVAAGLYLLFSVFRAIMSVSRKPPSPETGGDERAIKPAWNANRIRWCTAFFGFANVLIPLFFMSSGPGTPIPPGLPTAILLVFVPSLVMALCTLLPPRTPDQYRRMGLATLWILSPITVILLLEGITASPGRLNHLAGFPIMLVWMLSTAAAGMYLLFSAYRAIQFTWRKPFPSRERGDRP